MRKITIIALILTGAAFLVGFSVYNLVPEIMASHWDINGAVNGYESKNLGLFLLPVLNLFLLGLFWFLPKIDPHKKNFSEFEDVYGLTVLGVLAFLFYIYLLTIAWNLGYVFNLNLFIIPAFALLFYGLGLALPKVKQNWFMGIRTPWTLSSEKVWNKTNQLGGKLFKALGIAIILSFFFRDWLFWIVIFGSIGIALGLVIYSYFEYKKQFGGK